VRPNRLLLLVAVGLGLPLFGALGYVLIEGWGFLDALYMSVITLTSVGYMEVHPLSTGGRIFTMVFLLGGVFTLFVVVSEAVRTVVSGELGRLLGRQRMEKSLQELRDHFVVCGYGRMGRFVCREFSNLGLPFVVIDRNAALMRDFSVKHGIPLEGDATQDAVLRQAGIEHARGLVAAAASDADNVFITMSARLLVDRIPIVARAEEAASVPKLVRAGANRVVSPHVIGGGRVAQAVLRPAVLDFIEVATRSEHLDLQIEEVPVAAGSGLAGRTIATTGVRADIGLILVAVKQASGHMLFNPPDTAALAAGDTLIVLGKREQLDRADRLARVGAG
jgi:voltage-gated potassium channel